MKNIIFSDELVTALRKVWAEISPDAGWCSYLEAAELVMDRLTGPTGAELDVLIDRYGFRGTAIAVTEIL